MKLLLLTGGTALLVYGCILISENKCVGVLALGVGLYAMAESYNKK